MESGVELLHAAVGFDEAAVDFEGLSSGGHVVGEFDIPERLYCLSLAFGDVGEVVGERLPVGYVAVDCRGVGEGEVDVLEVVEDYGGPGVEGVEFEWLGVVGEE